MPFEGLARSISQEHAELHRQRTNSINSNRSYPNQPGFPPVSASISRPAPIPEASSRRPSTHSSATLAGDEERARDNEPKQKSTNEAEKAESSEKGENEKDKKEEDPFLVTMKGREHLHPHKWNSNYRWFLTAFAGLLVLNATFASSAPSGLIPSIIADFGVSQEVGILLIAIFVAGYCVGPLLWGPLSERYGRKLVFMGSWFPYLCFQIGCALSPNVGSLIAFRFLGGCFAAAPLTNSGGVIADLWDADRRGDALAIFSLMPFAGPALAPIISGVLEVRGIDWRWIFWILTIFAGVCFVMIIFLLPETYVPYILHKEAKRLRKETGDDRWYAQMDKKNEGESVGDVLHRTVAKPFIMIVQEPMLAVLTVYISFIYGIVYLLFEAVPIIFQGNHGFNALESGMVFLALLTGGFFGVIIYIFYFNKKYMKLNKRAGGKMVPPEKRLEPMMYAAPIYAAGFFIVGWTAYPNLNPAGPIIGVGILGLCVLFLFLSIFNYLIDTYLVNAASALAINTVCRSALGAGFPLFATQMFARLGIPGTCSLLGGLAICFIPAPFLLTKYGKKIRHLSKNAMVLEEADL